MDAITGVFRSRENASRAAAELYRAGVSEASVNVLFPGAPEDAVHSIPTSDTEQPGLGAAIGGMVGAAVGLGGGFELGAAAASLMIPGVGPVLAVGIAGAALLGVGGLIGGAALGSAAEGQSTEGLPADEVFFYEDALRQGRSLVIVLPRDHNEAEKSHGVLAKAGAEGLDTAREAWWIGLRDAEREHYHAFGHNFERDEDAYRAGFESALRRGQAPPSDRKESEAFRCGFERGQAYLKSRQPSLRAGGG